VKTGKLMKLSSVMAVLKAEPLTNEAEADLTGCYISDLLSDVLAHANPACCGSPSRSIATSSPAPDKDIGTVLFTCGRKPDRRSWPRRRGRNRVADDETNHLRSSRQTLGSRITMNQKNVSETARIAAMDTTTRAATRALRP